MFALLTILKWAFIALMVGGVFSIILQVFKQFNPKTPTDIFKTDCCFYCAMYSYIPLALAYIAYTF
jgi:hypothetical protein